MKFYLLCVTANTMFAKRERYDMQNSTIFRSLLNLSRIAILLCVTLSGCSPSEPSENEKDTESMRVEEVLRREKAVPITKDESDNLPEKVVALTKEEFDKLLTRKTHTNEIPKEVFYRITGVVEQRKAEISKATSDIRLILKPWQDSRVEVDCLFDRSEEQTISAMPLGTTVNVDGDFDSVSESTVCLIGCTLVK